MSDPKVIYLGPACEADGDGRTWAEDDPWPTCECGHKPVRYVLAEDFDRVTAERDALQLRLTGTDQRLDELISAVRSINHAKHHEVLMPGDDEPRYWQRKEWVDWVLSLCDAAPAPAAEPNCRQRLAAQGKPYPRSSCEACGQFSPKSRECDAMIAAELNTPQ